MEIGALSMKHRKISVDLKKNMSVGEQRAGVKEIDPQGPRFD